MKRRSIVVVLTLGVASLPFLETLAIAAPQDISRIERQVRTQLVKLPRFTVFDNLEFRVSGSTVTLLGQVQKPVLKKDAERAIMRVEGVNEVDNQIEVLPLSSGDDRIRNATYRAIYNYPMLSRLAIQPNPPIRIIVKNGHVTLEGAVSTASEKNVAGVQANGVGGVFSVTNNLHVVLE